MMNNQNPSSNAFDPFGNDNRNELIITSESQSGQDDDAAFDPFGGDDDNDDNINNYETLDYHYDDDDDDENDVDDPDVVTTSEIKTSTNESFFFNSTFETSFDSTSTTFPAVKAPFRGWDDARDNNNRDDNEVSSSTTMNYSIRNNNTFIDDSINRHQTTTTTTTTSTAIMNDDDDDDDDDDDNDVDDPPLRVVFPPEEIVVKVGLHEEMVCLYDGRSRTSSCSIKGSIQIKSAKEIEGSSFYLIIKDGLKHIKSMNDAAKNSNNAHCCLTNVSEETKYLFGLGDTNNKNNVDRAFKVTIPHNYDDVRHLAVVNYTCRSRLRPVPLIVRTKTHIPNSDDDNTCRVAIEIRSNPSNESPLLNLAILMAVPHVVIGDTVRLNQSDGVWDGMKRIIVWSLPRLDRGDALKLQAQFEFVDKVRRRRGDVGEEGLVFPVLVRCQCLQGQLSGVEVGTSQLRGCSSSIDIHLMRSYRVLYRKI